jgi:hypothetical protein
VALNLEKYNVKRVQGAVSPEHAMLNDAFVGPPRSPSSPGLNKTEQLALANGFQVFHKSFSGVNATYAPAYGQGLETPPLHECAAWRLAAELGGPLKGIVTPCVLREYDGEDGSLALRAAGDPNRSEPRQDPAWCDPAALFDSLIAQQDRHGGNYRWDGQRLTLYDHGYTFACPGHLPNNGVFIEERHAQGRAALAGWEQEALQRLIQSPAMLGMVLLLEPHRAGALRSRAEKMLLQGEILAWGDF